MKAQATMEAIAGFVILLFLLLIVLVFIFQRNSLTQGLDLDYKAENVCKKISIILSDVYSYGSGSSWQGSIDANILFLQGFLDVNAATGNSFCQHFAVLSNPNTRLLQGKMVFENTSGRVNVRNG